ncbi:MAG TPA: hypothetical protein VGC31_02085, partial [Paenirhodobacter sp.]
WWKRPKRRSGAMEVSSRVALQGAAPDQVLQAGMTQIGQIGPVWAPFRGNSGGSNLSLTIHAPCWPGSGGGGMRVSMILGLILAGCGASPAPQFFGAERHEITLEGYRFVVFEKDDSAEVIRLGYLTPRQRDPVPALMVEAAKKTTGCKVLGPRKGIGRSPSLPGDTGEARFELKC